jgi:hypothetical protein
MKHTCITLDKEVFMENHVESHTQLMFNNMCDWLSVACVTYWRACGNPAYNNKNVLSNKMDELLDKVADLSWNIKRK